MSDADFDNSGPSEFWGDVITAALQHTCGGRFEHFSTKGLHGDMRFKCTDCGEEAICRATSDHAQEQPLVVHLDEPIEYIDNPEELEYEALIALIHKAHDKMDDANALQSQARCFWCNGRGYDGNGLRHDDDCVVIEMRRAVELADVPESTP